MKREEAASTPIPFPTIRKSSHAFTRFDQIDQLVGASARAVQPTADEPWKPRQVCSQERAVHAHHDRGRRGPKLPYGTLPRLLMAWGSTEAVRTQSRELVLGDSLSEFMRTLGIYNSGGHPKTRLKNQMQRLF